MERRTASYTEEEEMNQRRRLLNLARKGDRRAMDKLFELYQVRVYPTTTLNRTPGRVPEWPSAQRPKKRSDKPAIRRRSARRTGGSSRRMAARKRVTRLRRTSRKKLAHR